VSDTLEADTIVIDIRTGAYYTLTTEAGPIWQEIQTSMTFDLGVDESKDSLVTALVAEGLLTVNSENTWEPNSTEVEAFTKYTDMEELLLADPIHEVDENGWPVVNIKNG